MKWLTATGGKVLVASSGVMIAAAAAMYTSAGEDTAHRDELEQSRSPALDAPAPAPAGASSSERVSARGTTATPAVAKVTPAPTSRSAGASADGCVYERDQRAAYKIVSQGTLEIDPTGFGLPAGSGGATKVEAYQRARLDTLVLDADEDGSLILARLSKFQSSVVQRDHIVEAPFLMRIGRDCSVQGYAHDRNLDSGYARIQQAMVHDLSFTAPSGEVTSFEGTDSLGSFEGEVSRVARDDRELFVKRIERFEPWQRGLGAVREVESFGANVVPSSDAWFESFVLDATYSGTGLESRRTLEATRIEEVGSFDGVSRSVDDYIWSDLLATIIPIEEEAPVSQSELAARDRLRGYSADEMLDRMIARVDTEGVGIEQTWPELKIYLEARPEMAAVVGQKLMDGSIPDHATMAGFMALGRARTPEARDALLGIMREESNISFDRTRAVFSLVDRADVGDGLAEELAELADPMLTTKDEQEHLLARHALLGLGMYAGLNPKREDIRAIAVEAISEVLEAAPNSVTASPAYGALSNIGDHRLLPMLDGIMDHPDYSTREVAAIATRRMDPDETAEFTQRWLEKEKDWRVKITIYRSLELQTFAAKKMTSRPVLELAVKDLEQGPGVLTRRALIRLLGRAIKTMGPEDPLRKKIERQFVSMISFEIEKRTGLYILLTEHLDPALIREGITREKFEPEPRAPADARPDPIQMRPLQ